MHMQNIMQRESSNPKDLRLKQTLYGYQIFFIVLSGVIGSGVFSNNGSALSVAGPWGLLLAVLIMCVVAIGVGECIGEMTQQFPVYNAVVAYVREFVDPDLGWVIGIAYWYSYAAAFAVQNVSAAVLSRYWGLTQTWQIMAFYFLAPILLFVLNMTGVFWYGIVETVGGLLKLCMIVGISIYLYVVAGRDDLGGNGSLISDGIKNDPNFLSTHGKAVCYAIPLAAYSFQGLEIIAMAAFEARDARALRWPSRWTPYIVSIVYIMCTVGEALTVSWADDHLPKVYGGSESGADLPNNPSSTNMIIIAAWRLGTRKFAGFLNGCLIFSVLSAGNTSLYASSRALFGITRELPQKNWINRKLKRLSVVTKRGRVPAASLFASWIAFYWVPFLQLAHGYAPDDIIQIMSFSGSTACLIVWASLCLSFIRYQLWLRKCDRVLSHERPEFKRGTAQYRPRVNFDTIQPIPAWIGLIGCLLTFGFSSATWWDTKPTFTKVATAYAAHVVLFVFFIVLKIINKRLFKPWGVRLTPDGQKLISVLERLEMRKLDKLPSRTRDRLERIFLFAKKEETTAGSSAVHEHGGGNYMNGALRDGEDRIVVQGSK